MFLEWSLGSCTRTLKIILAITSFKRE